MDLYTAQFRYSGDDRLDITVRTGNPIFAPSWEMVTGIKQETLSEFTYTEQYKAVMRLSYTQNYDQWQMLLDQPSVTLVCYCPANTFCHRHILAKLLVELGATYVGERILHKGNSGRRTI